MHEEEYLRPEQACRLLKIANRTLFSWEQQGKLNSIRTKGGHRRYLKSDIISKQTIQARNSNQKSYCYARVSSASQKDDLRRQVQFFERKYPQHIIISDIGSGINFKRKGLKKILDSGIKGEVKEIVVSFKDRLCRFGFDLIEDIISKYSDGKIVVLNQRETSPEKELVDDIISIITVFSSRLYGLRSHKIKNQIRGACENNENKIISNGETEGEFTSDLKPTEMVL